MKKNFYAKKLSTFKTILLAICACFIFHQETHSQVSDTKKWPSSDKTHSDKARVIIMNGNSSGHQNENFYVTWGKHNHWFSQGIRFEVQKERGIGARAGMFMDTSHLYLIGDWDNNSTEEDIIFGFNSNLRNNVDEKMRLTDEGLLGLGTNTPKGMLHVTGDTYSRGHVFLHAYEGDNESGTAYLQARDKSNSSSIGLQLRSQTNGNLVEALKISPEGNIGIGTTTPSVKLDVQGNTNIIGNTNIDGDTNLNGNTILNGDLSMGNLDQSQELFINKGLDIRLSNIENSHFSIQNAFGTDAIYVSNNGKIALGNPITTELTEQLHVGGRIKASGFIADASSFPDYVFSDEYELTPLEEVKKYTSKHHHLPGMPSEKDIISNGLDLKKVTTISVEKIEELYLHTIKQKELIEKQQDENDTIKKVILQLQQRLQILEQNTSKN